MEEIEEQDEYEGSDSDEYCDTPESRHYGEEPKGTNFPTHEISNEQLNLHDTEKDHMERMNKMRETHKMKSNKQYTINEEGCEGSKESSENDSPQIDSQEIYSISDGQSENDQNSALDENLSPGDKNVHLDLSDFGYEEPDPANPMGLGKISTKGKEKYTKISHDEFRLPNPDEVPNIKQGGYKNGRPGQGKYSNSDKSGSDGYKKSKTNSDEIKSGKP